MSTQSFDPVQFKAQQRQQWGAVASGWRKHWQAFERSAQPVSDRLIEMADLESGQRVLDVATGIGEPAVTAAHQVGPAGRVVAIDQAPQMIAIARERAAELGLRNMDFQEMDAEALDLPESSFDAVLCRWGLMFLPDLAAALGQMCRVLIPGGRLAAAVWDVPAKVPSLSLPRAVLGQMLEVPPPAAGTPGPFSLADSTALEQALTAAGFADVKSERLTVTYEFTSTDAYVAFVGEVSPINAQLAEQPATLRAEFWRAIGEAAQQYVAGDGRMRMDNEAICLVGHR